MNVRALRNAFALGLAVTGRLLAAGELPLSDGKWELKGDGIAVERHEGREVLAARNGFAYRRDVRLQDGTLELDVQLTRRRSFVYVAFRMEHDGAYEEIYLRPHKSGLPDAVQYAPVHQGHSAWQLYHGPGATAAVAFEPGVFTHVKLVLQGRRAALFLGGGARPAFVARLAREPRAGYVALRVSQPPGTPNEGPLARFANVVVRPDVVDFDFASVPEPPDPTPAPGVVRAWALSRAFVPGEGHPAELPAPAALGELRRVDARADGLVELHRAVTLPAGSRAAAAVARVRLRAAQTRVYALDLGFSDRATVFLDGRPLFAGDASYSFDVPRRDGLIGYEQARLFLPLAAGEHELAVLVADGFGGWGLMGRFADPAGLELEAR